MAGPVQQGPNFDAARPSVGISQTAFIFGALVFSFVVFVTMRGDLPKWLGLLGLAGVKGGAGAPASAATSSPLGTSGNPVSPSQSTDATGAQWGSGPVTNSGSPLSAGPGASMLGGVGSGTPSPGELGTWDS